MRPTIIRRVSEWSALTFALLLIAFVAWAAVSPARGVALSGSTVLVNLTAGHGSGVHIGNGYIITAAHVVADEKEITVKTDDGRTFKPDVMWINERYDLALLKISPDRLASRGLRCTPPVVGESVWSLGNPFSLEFVAFYGRIAGPTRGMGDWPDAVPLDLTVGPGMSGGPLIDGKGMVVGIIVATLKAAPIGAAVPSSTVCRLMGRVA